MINDVRGVRVISILMEQTAMGMVGSSCFICVVLQMQYMRMLYVFGISIAWTYGCFVFLFEDKNIRHSCLLILVFLVSVLIHYPAVKRRKVMREVER